METTKKINSTSQVLDVYIVGIKKLEEGVKYELQFEQGDKVWYKWGYIEYHILLENSYFYQDESLNPMLLKVEEDLYIIQRLQEQLDDNKLEYNGEA
tara:strand:+ start:24 stop:314 length:291 start_codon:yes stop_codon:yes gene_type:complete